MQLPGRLLFVRHTGAVSPMLLVGASVGLQVTGLAWLAVAHSVAGIAAGVSLFAGGSGLATIARPVLVLVFYGQDRAGEMNGRLARPQQLARAAGPVSAAARAGALGYGVVFASLAALLAIVVVVLLRRSRPGPPSPGVLPPSRSLWWTGRRASEQCHPDGRRPPAGMPKAT